VRDKVLAAVESRRFCLVENMARAILDEVRKQPRITRIYVKVTKSKALQQARAVTAAVEWVRAT